MSLHKVPGIGLLCLFYRRSIHRAYLISASKTSYFSRNVREENSVFLLTDVLTRHLYRLTMSGYDSYRSIFVSMANAAPRFPADFQLADRDFLSGKTEFYRYFRLRWTDFNASFKPAPRFLRLFRRAKPDEFCKGYNLRCRLLTQLAQSNPTDAKRFSALPGNEISLFHCALDCFTDSLSTPDKHKKALTEYEAIYADITGLPVP